MKNFLVFLVAVFLGLFLAVVYRSEHSITGDKRPTLKIFSYSSFVSQWGAGPLLKEKFEKDCNCRVEFFDAADAATLLQRLQLEGTNSGADLIIGIDQYDLEKAETVVSWKLLQTPNVNFAEEIREFHHSAFFIPYDYGVVSFNFKKSETSNIPKSFEDLLRPEFKHKIALEDPRTSSPGMQFLFWLVRTKGEDEAFSYLQKLNENIHSMSPNWSTAYGFFQKGQAATVVSYSTSPIYHLVEQKSNDFVAADFKEGHPMQVEFMAVPTFCKQCDLAQKFVEFVLGNDGQKIIMEKNYMLPVVKTVTKGTPFEHAENLKTIPGYGIPSKAEQERILKKWTDYRHQSGL